jgi:hypothetical protein
MTLDLILIRTLMGATQDFRLELQTGEYRENHEHSLPKFG